MVSHANAVFYATTYHPIQAGSIDGTHISAHDNAVHRALLATTTGLYDPLKDPKAKGDPYCSLYIGRLSAQTDENSLREAMSRFGQVKNLRLVRHIVTGASCGYAFVEFERERDMRHAYESAHQLRLDGASILVDYNRQQLMPGWIPRRLGGGLGGKKESGQLRFGGRDRPFRAPLPPIPREKLMKLGIPLPPEGRYMSRFQVPPPPQRKRTADDVGTSESKHRRVHSVEDEDSKERTSYEEHGSEAGEGRDSYLHRRRKDEFRDRVDRGRHHEAESRSHYRKHEGEEEEEEERGQESRRESRYEGFEFEPKRQSSREGRDAEDTRHGGERAERKRRKEYSNERHEYEDEGLTRQGRWKPEDELQQSRVSRDTDVGDAHDRHHESRHRSKGHRQSSRENDRKHRQSDSKHRRGDEDEDRAQRSSRKHKHHRERSGGEDHDGEEKERKRSKHREHDI